MFTTDLDFAFVGKTILGIAIPAFILVGVGTGVGIGDMIVSCGPKKESQKYAREISENVKATTPSIKYYDFNSLTVDKDEAGCYVNLFGKAHIYGQDEPVFASFKYDGLNEDTYNKIQKHVTTEFSSDDKGTIDKASINTNTEWFRTHYKLLTEIFKEVAQITKKQAIEQNYFGSCDEVITSAAKDSGKDIVIHGISNVLFTSYKSTPLSGVFYINTAKKENDKIILKQLEVVVDLDKICKDDTKKVDLVNTPEKIYDFYAKNPNECEVTLTSTTEIPIIETQNTQDLDSGRDL